MGSGSSGSRLWNYYLHEGTDEEKRDSVMRWDDWVKPCCRYECEDVEMGIGVAN